MAPWRTEVTLIEIYLGVSVEGQADPWSPAQWTLALALFGRILDGESADAILSEARELQVADILAEMLQRHAEVGNSRFLEDPPTLVRQLTGDESPAFELGQCLAGRFTILRLLGQGGMGEVYLAQDNLFNEVVAVKTIRRALGVDLSMRKRFLAEAQSARHVTHPSVCRIFDLYDSDEGPFYSMEYLAGPTLAEVLKGGPIDARQAQGIALEIAEGLQAAHRRGILHCDLKPSNVILGVSGRAGHAVLTDFGLARAFGTDSNEMLAGTRNYMAPELLTGACPDVLTDIFAFGRLVTDLRPKNRIGAWCAAPNREDRPSSMDLVLAAMRPNISRRNWLTGVGITAVLTGSTIYQILAHRSPLVGGRQRLIIGLLQPSDSADTRIVRELLTIALRQSPLLGIIPDDQLRLPSGGALVQAGLPLEEILKLSQQGISSLVLDGKVHRTGTGLEVELSLFETGGGRQLVHFKNAVPDRRQIVRLAENSALQLRSAIGESRESLRAPYAPLEQVTSPSLEAAELYFRAAHLYERGIREGDTEAAIDLLAHATQIDPSFALAYHLEAMVFSATDRVADSEAAALRAMEHRDRLSPRERNWIEGFYGNIIGDFNKSEESYRRNVGLYPEEAVFHRQFAFAVARLGRYGEAISQNQEAARLAPFSAHCASELVVNLAEAGRAKEALNQAEGFIAQGFGSEVFRRGMGLALMQLGRFEEARIHFAAMQQGSVLSPLTCFYQSGPLILLGEFREAERILRLGLTSSGARDYADHQIRLSLGSLYWLQGRAAEASDCLRPLAQLPMLGCNMRHVRHCGFLLAKSRDARLAWDVADWLREYAKLHSYPHAVGGSALADAMAFEIDSDPRAELKYEEALAKWPDALTLLAAAGWHRKQGNLPASLSALERFDVVRGAVLKNSPAGLVMVAQIERAKTLLSLSHFEEALRIYEQVRKQCGSTNPALPALLELQHEILRHMGRSLK